MIERLAERAGAKVMSATGACNGDGARVRTHAWAHGICSHNMSVR